MDNLRGEIEKRFTAFEKTLVPTLVRGVLPTGLELIPYGRTHAGKRRDAGNGKHSRADVKSFSAGGFSLWLVPRANGAPKSC